MDPSTPVRIDRITVSASPKRRTHLSYFENELQSILPQAASRSAAAIDASQSLMTVHTELQKTYQRLQQSGLFEVVDVELKVKSLEADGRCHSDVDIYVKEKGIPCLKMESFLQAGSSQGAGNSSNSSNNIGFEIKGALRNPFGYGEQYQIAAGGNNAGRKENSLYVHIPHSIMPQVPLNITAKSVDESSSMGSASSAELFTSFSTNYKTLVGDIQFGRFGSIAGEISVRDEIPLKHEKEPFAKDTSLAVLSQLSSSVKASLKYHFAYDTRDSVSLPSSGNHFSQSVEIALPPGDARFIKSDLHFQQHFSFLRPKRVHSAGRNDSHSSNNGNGLVLSLVGNLGVIQPLSLFTGKNIFQSAGPQPLSSVFLSDRYHSGGPMILRGFSIYGIGARANPKLSGGYEYGDAIGGLVKSSFIAALSCPLPFRGEVFQSMKAFVYVNGGSLGMGKLSRASPSLVDFFGHPRLSLGSGLAINLSDMARLEVTYSLPLLRSKHDIIKPFQIGMGLSIN